MEAWKGRMGGRWVARTEQMWNSPLPDGASRPVMGFPALEWGSPPSDGISGPLMGRWGTGGVDGPRV